MRHKVEGRKLGREKAPREMMLKNLASSVLIYEKIKTTSAKAKAVKPLVEKAITIAKKGDLASRRKLITMLPQKMAVKKAMEVIGKRYADKQSGYTRIVKIGPRQGDGAEIVQLELI